MLNPWQVLNVLPVHLTSLKLPQRRGSFSFENTIIGEMKLFMAAIVEKEKTIIKGANYDHRNHHIHTQRKH